MPSSPETDAAPEQPEPVYFDPVVLRAVLEAIWNDPVVRCPRHIVCWNADHGKRADQDLPLFYAKGERVDAPKHQRVKSTGARIG